jgi:hypothetical protein
MMVLPLTSRSTDTRWSIEAEPGAAPDCALTSRSTSLVGAPRMAGANDPGGPPPSRAIVGVALSLPRPPASGDDEIVSPEATTTVEDPSAPTTIDVVVSLPPSNVSEPFAVWDFDPLLLHARSTNAATTKGAERFRVTSIILASRPRAHGHSQVRFATLAVPT